MNLLFDVDGDEISPVRRAANRRRFALLKGDQVGSEIEDIASVPWEHEGAMVDSLRKEGVDEAAQQATLTAMRLLNGVASGLPDEIRGEVEKLGRALHPAETAPVSKDAAETETKPDEDAEKNDLSADDAVAKAWIIRRATSLGVTSLLKQLGLSKGDTDDGAVNDDTTGGDTVAEEQILAVPVQKDDGSWDLSGVPESNRPFYASVLKSNEDLATQLKETREDLAKADEKLEKADEALRTREYIEKAGEFGKVAPADELGQVLKEAAAKFDPETFEKLEGVLKGAQERIDKGELFKEFGASALNDGSKTDAWSQIEKKAAELVEKSDTLTKEQAISRALELNPDLYSRYLVETSGGVA